MDCGCAKSKNPFVQSLDASTPRASIEVFVFFFLLEIFLMVVEFGGGEFGELAAVLVQLF